MKIHVKFPGGGEISIEKEPKEPMNSDRFGSLCGLCYAAMGLIGVLGFFSMFR